MLEILRRIIQEVNEAQTLQQALDLIVTRVKSAVAADVCSVYLTDYRRGEQILMATDGLNPQAVGTVRLPLPEGLIGLINERAEPLNLEDAHAHRRYRFVAETGEQRFHGFLGVPIIQHRKVLGVLVVRQRDKRRFAEDEVTFLVTLAAQLAGAISHAEASGEIHALLAEVTQENRFVQGLVGSPGVAVGIAVVVYPPMELDAVPDRRNEDVEAEEKRFHDALLAVRDEIEYVADRVEQWLPAEDRALFDAYALILRSDSLLKATVQRIHAGQWAPAALRDTIREHVRAFEQMQDDYFRERASDIRDLGRRILAHLQSSGNEALRDYPDNTVLVGEELGPMQLAHVPAGKLVGVVSTRGSGSSHIAILARAMGVPAIMGVTTLPVKRIDGQEIVLDGDLGRIYIRPPAALRAEYLAIAKQAAALSAQLEPLRKLPASTRDGKRVPVLVNTGLTGDIGPSVHSGADGVGLYRTELPFLIRDRFPGEREQTEIYRNVLAAFAPRPVTLRTLDVGGDKLLSYFPVREDNPFLGWRGIRITLDHPDIFLTQLRAMLRADIGLHNLHIMLPMISDVGEFEEAQRLVQRAHDELREEGDAVRMPPVGVMVEVPSAVYQADGLARRAAFLSIGTNDLTQYLLAVDRNNPRVAALYNHLHPAVLRAIQAVTEAAHRNGKTVSVCGEMAADPCGALLLLGIGVDSLSMSVPSLTRIKWLIRSCECARARALAQEALALDDAAEVRRLANAALAEFGLEALIRKPRADTPELEN